MSGLHPKARELIDAANRAEAPPSEEALLRVRRSVLRRAAMTGAVVTAAGTAKATTKAGLLGAGIGVKLISFGIVGAVAGLALMATRSTWLAPKPNAKSNEWVPAVVVQPTDAGRETTNEVPDLRPGLEAPIPSPRIAQAANEGRQRRTDERRRSVPADVPPRQEAPTASSDDARSATNLAHEVEVLRRVHAALGQSRFQDALDLLHRNEDILTGGSLQEEAQAARISALCQLGRDADARAAIAGFLAHWPQSLFAARVRHGCDDLVRHATQ